MSASVAQVIEFSCTKLLLFALLEFHSKFPVYVVEVDMDISYEKVNEKWRISLQFICVCARNNTLCLACLCSDIQSSNLKDFIWSNFYVVHSTHLYVLFMHLKYEYASRVCLNNAFVWQTLARFCVRVVLSRLSHFHDPSPNKFVYFYMPSRFMLFRWPLYFIDSVILFYYRYSTHTQSRECIRKQWGTEHGDYFRIFRVAYTITISSDSNDSNMPPAPTASMFLASSISDRQEDSHCSWPTCTDWR